MRKNFSINSSLPSEKNSSVCLFLKELRENPLNDFYSAANENRFTGQTEGIQGLFFEAFRGVLTEDTRI